MQIRLRWDGELGTAPKKGYNMHFSGLRIGWSTVDLYGTPILVFLKWGTNAGMQGRARPEKQYPTSLPFPHSLPVPCIPPRKHWCTQPPSETEFRGGMSAEK